MKDKKKKRDEQEKLLDHIIEYGGQQYIDDEVENYKNLPEKELPEEFDQRMNKIFKEAYRKESLRERLQSGKKIAVIAVVVLGIASVTAMNVKAFREPVLNFIFKMNGSKNKTKVKVSDESQKSIDFSFKYLPTGYECTKKTYFNNKSHIAYEFQNKNNEFVFINVQLNETQESYSNMSQNEGYEELRQNNKTYYFLNGKNNTLLYYKNNSIFKIIGAISDKEMINIANHIESN